MSLLCVLNVIFIVSRALRQVTTPVELRDNLARIGDRNVGEVGRVGTHIGNMPGLVESLSG